MKVAISNPRSGWGGASAVSLTLGQGLARRGHEVDFLTRPGSPLMARAREAGFDAVEILRGYDFPPVPVLRSALTLRRRGVDVVVGGPEKDLRMGSLGARVAGIRVVLLGVTGPGDGWLETRLWRRVPDHIVANSEATRRSFLALDGIAPDDVSVVYNGIDLTPFSGVEPADLGLPKNAFVVGFVGRMAPDKGVEYLIRAWPRIREAIPGARLVLAGSGGLEEHLRPRTADDPTVLWLGFRRDVPAVLGACHVLVVPSPEEAFGLAAVEAMASGVPVVGTRSGGLPEVVREDREGLMVPPRDADALAGAVIRLHESEELRSRLAASGPARAQAFSEERMLDGFEAVLRRVVGTPTGVA